MKKKIRRRERREDKESRFYLLLVIQLFMNFAPQLQENLKCSCLNLYQCTQTLEARNWGCQIRLGKPYQKAVYIGTTARRWHAEQRHLPSLVLQPGATSPPAHHRLFPRVILGTARAGHGERESHGQPTCPSACAGDPGRSSNPPRMGHLERFPCTACPLTRIPN